MGDTILVFRSGRHLVPAVAALRNTYPGRRIIVVAQPGTDAELDRAGVRQEDRLVYRKRRFGPLRFLFSRAGWAALCLRGAQVAVLWNDHQGRGQWNVTLTAALAGRGKVLPITPEGILAPVRCDYRFRAAMRRLLDRVPPALACLAARWDALRTRVEGAELEPPIWHSHYLALRVAEQRMPALGRRLSGLVLDIGAGTGYAARFLDPAGARYLPTDLPTGRDSGDTTISRCGSRPRVFCSGAALPFADACLDGVMAVSVLEHVKDVPSILREALRVLRPGGRILISTPFSFPFHGQPDDFRRWTDEGLATELLACGFEAEHVERIGSSLSSLVQNFHLVVKYEWREAPSWLLRAISRWGWPLMLPFQAMTNAIAVWCDRLEPESRMPIGIGIVARRPAAGAAAATPETVAA